MPRPRRACLAIENSVEAATIGRAAQTGRAGPASPAEGWSYEPTRILEEAFEDLDTARTLNFLDAGPVQPQTVGFFRRFRCRLYVADLFGTSLPARGASPVEDFFGTVDGVRFVVCFLWDYLNYPDNAAFAEFVDVLADHVHEKTRLYAIGAYSEQLPLKAYRYAIADTGRLAIRPAGGTAPEPRSRNDVVKAMRQYAVQRSALRRDNRLELLLRTVRNSWA